MYKCSVCGVSLKTVKSYVNHFRLHRNVNNLRFKCCVENCPNTFATYSAFATHISKYHSSSSHAENSDEFQVVSLRCSLNFCGQVFNGTKALLSHLKMHVGNNTSILCPFVNCEKSFSKKSSFTSHISRQHPKLTRDFINDRYKVEHVDIVSSTEPCGSVKNAAASFMNCKNVEAVDDEFDLSESSDDLGEHFKRNLALFYLKLQSKLLLPASVIQLIVEEFTSFHAMNQEYLFSQAKEQLISLGLSNESAGSVLRQMKDNDLVFLCNQGDLRNDYMRKKFYKEQLHYVEPKPFLLGQENNRKDRYGQYVAVADTIQSLFKDQSVRTQYLNPLKKTPGLLSDVVDGSVFCNNAFFKSEPHAIKIILYQDAFEIVNPLGSAKKKHKMLGIYMTLADIYPHNRSTIDQMQLVLMCREADQKTFGWEKILNPLIHDIQKIESDGIVIFDDVTAKGSVVSLVGDNLGSHGVGGFVESFSASYFCRYCLVTRDDFSMSPSFVGETRTRENYNCDVQQSIVDGCSRGVKSDSSFNRLKHFHVCAPGLPPCLGHDLFEGVVDVDLFLYINQMVNVLKWFSYDFLNRRINQFKYLGDDAASKPCAVNAKGDRLGGHAVQNWCLLRILVLLIGDRISDPENEVWQLYLLLKKIVELVCSKSIAHSQVAYLHVLVEDYLDRRLSAFPNVRLRPKHHYLMHYADLTLKFGPLMHLWTLRFESKHSYFKRCVRYSQNFKNVCSMLAERQQFLQSYLLQGSLFPADIQIEAGIPLCSSLFSDITLKAINDAGIKDNQAVVCTRAVVKGCRYSKDLYIVFKCSAADEVILFGKIVCILVSREIHVNFLVEVVVSEYISDRHAHYLRSSDPSCYMCVSEEHLCHIGALPGYDYLNGVVLVAKSAI